MAITSQILYDQTMTNYADRRKNLEKARDEALAAQKTQYDNASLDLNKSHNKALQEAYITKMQSRKSVPQMLAQQGINGGASETTLSNINRAYQNARNTANDNYNTNKITLDTNYGDNTRQIRENYQDRLDALADVENETKMTWAQYLAEQAAAAAASSGGGYGSYGSGSSSSNSAAAPTRNTSANGSGYRNGIYNGGINDNANNTSTLVSKMMIRNPNSSQYGKIQYKYRNSDGSYRYEVR